MKKEKWATGWCIINMGPSDLDPQGWYAYERVHVKGKPDLSVWSLTHCMPHGFPPNLESSFNSEADPSWLSFHIEISQMIVTGTDSKDCSSATDFGPGFMDRLRKPEARDRFLEVINFRRDYSSKCRRDREEKWAEEAKKAANKP